MPQALRVVVIKPSKYGVRGHVERFRRGFMPNSTITYIQSMTPKEIDGHSIETVAVDEYVQTDLDYLELLHKSKTPTLLALVGVQSHQFHRSLDLAAYALSHGTEYCVIGGPHPMTCDTSAVRDRGVSFSLAEAEVVWPAILRDAIHGKLEAIYGSEHRWQKDIHAPVLIPPSARDLRRYILPMMGIYPARGCPFTCNFCSVIKVAGRQIRSQSIEVTMATLTAARQAGVRLLMFTSDNFNKYPEAAELLRCMIQENIGIPFFVQCDTQVSRDEEFIALLARAGCFQMFVGVESFRRKVLLGAHKGQNHPESYSEIIRLCRKYHIDTHFSNIIGFPGDSAEDIREQVRILKVLDPDVASFYILTPIPGTDQYEDLLAAGRIFESNLDRFDGTATTWNHDVLSAPELQELLFECYRSFASAGKIARTVGAGFHSRGAAMGSLASLGMGLFSRFCASKKMHPMSGGVGRVLLDSAADYRQFRQDRYHLDLVPLPRSLELSKSDAESNRRVKIAM